MNITSIPHDILHVICFTNTELLQLQVDKRKLCIYDNLCLSMFFKNNSIVIRQLKYISNVINKLKYIKSFSHGVYLLAHPVKTLCFESDSMESYKKRKKLPITFGGE